jgi:hypothetical protein
MYAVTPIRKNSVDITKKNFTKGSFFIKVYILEKLKKISLSKVYLPDNIKIRSLTRNFLMNIRYI